MTSSPHARVFVSYARADHPKVDTVVEGLRSLHTDVWRDESLAGGQRWWDEILTQIRACDVFVQAVSTAAIESEACTRERAYAMALGKPVLPVVVGQVEPELLPSDLALLQLVDYTEATAAAAFRVADALTNCPPAPPLPEELPDPPPVPVSYLASLADRVRAPALSLDEQLALVARLRTAVEHNKDRTAATELLGRLQERDDLYAAAAREIDKLLALAADATAEPASHQQSVRRPNYGAPALRESKVVVYGYTQWFLMQPAVRVFWNGTPVGSVKKGKSMWFSFDADGEVSFRCGFRSASVHVQAGRVTNIKLAFDRISGKLTPQIVDVTPEPGG